MIWRFSIIPLIIFSVFVNSCRNSANSRKDTPPAKTLETRDQVNGSIHSDTVRIEGNAAVFYKPDSAEWNRIGTLTDPGIFESTQHDCFFQQRNARAIISKFYPHVQIIEVNRNTLLYFFIKTGGRETFDLNTNTDPCGILFFNGQVKPRPADMTNIDTELWQYFSN